MSILSSALSSRILIFSPYAHAIAAPSAQWNDDNDDDDVIPLLWMRLRESLCANMFSLFHFLFKNVIIYIISYSLCSKVKYFRLFSSN